jgi:hypothetical protein
LQHIKSFRPGRGPSCRRSRRVGADAAFAKALARSEFGRFYVDDQQQREVQRSIARAKGPAEPAAPRKAADPSPPKAGKPKLWHRPSVRERRTEIADARAKLAAAAKLRQTRDE